MVDNNVKFKVASHMVMIFLCLCCVLPFLLLLSSSVTEEATLIKEGYSFLPKNIDFSAYIYLLTRSSALIRGYLITIGVTVVGTVINLTLTTLFAYPLSRKDLPHRNILAFIIFFTMLFNGGLVPSYIMWSKYLHINNSYAALILPNLLMQGFYVIMMRTFFTANIPDAVVEAAKIDGAGEANILRTIVLPMSKPIIATLVMMVGLMYWNDWTNGLYYINKDKFFSVQVLLNRMLSDVQFLKNSSNSGQLGNLAQNLPSTGIKMAVAVMGALPVMAIYPFFQKYFIEGITIGAVKG